MKKPASTPILVDLPRFPKHHIFIKQIDWHQTIKVGCPDDSKA